MYEKHENEQYFFDQPTVAHLAEFASNFQNPCCLCAPLLGQELEKRSIEVTSLDVDDRFAALRGFRSYDLYRPQYLGEQFGLIICDPPFFRVSLAQLFNAIWLLSRHDYEQPLLICYLVRRSANLMGTFWRFGLEATGYRPAYQTVQKMERNDIEFYGNLGAKLHRKLAAPAGDL